ncbi:MAG: GGDEF domain-containing protein, partial [Anaerolineales bacterium]|nr:GGDEF domain-containing protein [Anaerolineales bacterium]
RVLELAADVIRQSYRASDVVARVGGDEFVLLAMDCAEHDAEMLRLRLISSAETAADRANLPCDLKLTVGIACYPPESEASVMEMVARADRAMYRERGRAVGGAGQVEPNDPNSDGRELNVDNSRLAEDQGA